MKWSILAMTFLFTLSVWAVIPRGSTPPFMAGIELRQSNFPISSCKVWKDKELFCAEGFYMRDAFSEWTYQDKIKTTWSWPLPLSGVQKVSIGMALGFQNVRPAYPWNFLPQIIDGWAFAMVIKEGRVPPGLCRPFSGGYCEFGAGRGLYFVGGKPSNFWEELGLDFAHGMHGEKTKDPWMTKISSAILSGDFKSLRDKISCLDNQHFIDCGPRTP